MCGGPFSWTTSKLTVKLRFNATSWTREMGDFNSDDESVSKTVPKVTKQ